MNSAKRAKVVFRPAKESRYFVRTLTGKLLYALVNIDVARRKIVNHGSRYIQYSTEAVERENQVRQKIVKGRRLTVGDRKAMSFPIVQICVHPDRRKETISFDKSTYRWRVV